MENKKKIDLKGKSNSTFKIGDETIKIKSWLNGGEAAFIVNEAISYFKELVEEDNSDAICLISALSKMDMLLVALATDLDIEDISYDDLGATGIFNAIQEKLLNYDMIKTAVMCGISMVGENMVITQLEQVASLSDLANATDNMEKYFNEGNSENVKQLIEAMLANNPMLASALNEQLGGEQNGDS